jgi:predicted Zn finger-like uncharacterized protein
VYTQCPDCATVFRITAEVLRAAQGDVRCGVCSTTFNALENLSERAFKAGSPDETSPDDSMTVEELPGGESIELSAPAELAVVPDAPEPVQEARAADDEALAMEFHGESVDLDRLFVVENPALESFDAAAAAANLAAAEPPVELDSTDEHPIIILDERDELPDEPEPGQDVTSAEPGPERQPATVVESIVLETAPDPAPPAPPVRQWQPAATSQTAPRILIPDEMRKRLAEEAAARAAADREFEPDEENSPGFLSKRWPWTAACATLAVLFVLQLIHGERHDIVRSPTFGPALAGAYALFGLSPLAPSDLSAYELRQWGAASDPREANRLVLRASIVNRASFAQPLPLLRLTLQDRYGATLGERDIGPSDYLPGAGNTGLLEPGQRADALIRIVDPGAEAVGFELDVCLPARGGVRCANQVKTARQ